MKIKHIIRLAVLALTLGACTSDEITQSQPASSTEKIPFKAVINADQAGTRGLTEATDGKSIAAKWEKDEMVAVVHGQIVDVLTVESVDATSGAATISGEITSPTNGEAAQVVYAGHDATMVNSIKSDLGSGDRTTDITYNEITEFVKAELDDQKGTLDDISDYLDYRFGEATLVVSDGNATFEKAPTLNPQFTVLKVSLTTDGTTALAAKKLVMKNGTETAAAIDLKTDTKSTFYVAFAPDGTSKSYTFEATDAADKDYSCDLTIGKALESAKFYTAKLTMLFDMLHTPLTLEAVESGTIEVTIPDGLSQKIYYKINGGDKTELSGNISVNAGDIVQFFSTNSSLAGSNIKPSKKTYVYGNVMSLIDDGTEGFANDKVIGADNALRGLFSFAANIDFHDTKQLLLPATTLTNGCYANMFGRSGLTSLPENLLPATTLTSECYYLMFTDCTGLTSLPEKLLPATTLASKCYNYMFSGCTGLESLPEKLLPATTLASKCYYYMFTGCTGLETLPEKLLPATTLAEECYYQMFSGCTGLESLPEKLLPATTLTKGCYKNMFDGCTGLTSLPEKLLPATTLAESCYLLMFYNCTGLTSLPEKLLPATTLANYCYNCMFQGCKGLETVPAKLLPATTLANSCYGGMFIDCSSLVGAPGLPATKLEPNCYSYMFQGCTALTTAPALPATSLADAADCYSSMFQGCTALTTAPELPATSLAYQCYGSMFRGCTKLSSVKCLATDISAPACLDYWLKGAGTADGCERKVYVDPSMTSKEWGLDSSGEDGKRWTAVGITQ